MNAPMMLPWLARKWDVSDERALELWREACRDAAVATGEHSSSDYWGFARGRLIDLLDAEVIARYPAIETPWIMIQLNLLRFIAAVRCWIFARRQGFVHSL
jgi:hypothetical protein